MSADPLPTTLGDGVLSQKSTFSERGHVAYQIKGNHKCSNVVANILPADPLSSSPNTPTLGMGQ